MSTTKEFVSLRRLSKFLEGLMETFAPVEHKHTISDVTDYVVDEALSADSTNPVQTKVIEAEFHQPQLL